MAANEPDTSTRAPSGEPAPLSADALARWLDEEIGRAERMETQLSCLLVIVDDLEELAREHGRALAEETLAYVARALRPQLRRFDRIGRPADGELLIVLPGADGPRGEMVARRVIARTRTIKLEAGGARRPLNVSVGLAAWRAPMDHAALLARSREAARRPAAEPAPAATGARGVAAAEHAEQPQPPPGAAVPRPARS